MELPTPQPQRVNFIARKQSYHGNTLGSLSVGHHVGRRALYEKVLAKNVSHVSQCYPYRDMKPDEEVESYVGRLAQELEDEFQRLGPDTVCAFVAETMAGAVSIPSANDRNLYLQFNLDPWMHACPSRILEGYERGLPAPWCSAYSR